MKNIIVLLAALAIWTSEVGAQTPYFQGKTIRFIVGYPAGSTHDQWARLVGPHLTNCRNYCGRLQEASPGRRTEIARKPIAVPGEEEAV